MLLCQPSLHNQCKADDASQSDTLDTVLLPLFYCHPEGLKLERKIARDDVPALRVLNLSLTLVACRPAARVPVPPHHTGSVENI